MSGLRDMTARERTLVLVALPLVALLAGWRLGWEPLDQARAARETEIAGYRLLAQTAAAGAAPVASTGAPEPFAARVTQSAEAAGLSLARIEPENDGLRVAIAEAAFPQVMLWIADLEAERGVVLAAIELDRQTEPGVVSARLLLEDSR